MAMLFQEEKIQFTIYLHPCTNAHSQLNRFDLGKSLGASEKGFHV